MNEEPTRYIGHIRSQQAVTEIRVDLFVLSGLGTVSNDVVGGYAGLKLKHHSRDNNIG